jgi:hypothetical protein
MRLPRVVRTMRSVLDDTEFLSRSLPFVGRQSRSWPAESQWQAWVLHITGGFEFCGPTAASDQEMDKHDVV